MKFFLEGKIAALRQLQESDFALLSKWLNDPETTYFMFYGQRPQTEEQVKEHFVHQLADEANTIFMVLDRKTGSPIGFAGLYHMHFSARKAEFRILIGEKKFRGRGYGTEVAQLLMFYGFDRLNLHKVHLGVTIGNSGAIKAYERAGFKKEGILKDDIYRNSRYYDAVCMAVFREEYYKTLYPSHKKKFSI